MKKFLLLIPFLSAIALGQQKPGKEDAGNSDLPVESDSVAGFLTFANEDKISGSPEGIDEDGNLRWNAGFLHQPIPVKPSSLLEMRLEGGAETHKRTVGATPSPGAGVPAVPAGQVRAAGARHRRHGGGLC